MAYVLPNQGVIQPPRSGHRYVHRQVTLNPAGADGSAAATAQVAIPSPGRLIAYAVDYTTQAATTDILIKADSTAGVTIETITDVNTDIALKPVGTTSVDEGRAATAATDAFSGGFPVRTGVFIDVAQADNSAITGSIGAKSIVVDLYFRLCTYAVVKLVAQSGADGSGAVTQTLRLNGAGTLAAVAIDFQNTPNTADLIIKADDTNGTTLFTSANSNTDLAPSLLGRPGQDEAQNASAATDGTEGANMFKQGLFFDLAQTDIFTSGNEITVVELWIDM